MKNNTALIILILMWGMIIGMIGEYVYRYEEIHQQKVDLPEEYLEITKEDNLQGYFDDKGTLIINFNNPSNKSVDYQIDLRKDYKVDIKDKNGLIVKTTSLDSIPYWIEKDNL